MTQLLASTQLNAEQREYAQEIRHSGETLVTVIENLLDFSRLETTRLPIHMVQFSPRTVVEDVLTSLAAQAEAKDLALSSRVYADVPSWVSGDADRLQQILFHLVGNAVKFTEAGEVVVHVKRTPETPSAVGLRFEVSDTGIGVPADAQDRLFHAFSQADGSSTRKYGGAGLGLAIAKRLVDVMGGDIGFTRAQNMGSTFWFTVRFGEQMSPRHMPPPLPVADLRREMPIPSTAETFPDTVAALQQVWAEHGPDVALELCELFESQTLVVLATARDALVQGDRATLQQALLRLQGSSASLGVRHMEALCIEMLQQQDLEWATDTETLMEPLEMTFQHVQQALATVRQ